MLEGLALIRTREAEVVGSFSLSLLCGPLLLVVLLGESTGLDELFSGGLFGVTDVDSHGGTSEAGDSE
jgi:hypothetical protein